MRGVVTTLLDALTVVLVIAGAVSLWAGVSAFSWQVGLIVAGLELVALAFFVMWISRRVG